MGVCAVNAMQHLMCYSQPGSGGGGVGSVGGALIYGPAITCDTHRAASGDVSLLLTEEKIKKSPNSSSAAVKKSGAGGRRAGGRRRARIPGGRNRKPGALIRGHAFCMRAGRGAPGTIGCRRGYGGRRR